MGRHGRDHVEVGGVAIICRSRRPMGVCQDHRCLKSGRKRGRGQSQVVVHQARQCWLLHPSSRAGRNNNAWSKAKIAPTVSPRRRNGKEISQTRGKRTKASNATGQHRTNSMHQKIKSSRTFIFLALKFGVGHSTPLNGNEPFQAPDVKWEIHNKLSG